MVFSRIKQERSLIKKMYDSVYSDKARKIGSLIRDKVFSKKDNIGQNCILSRKEIRQVIAVSAIPREGKVLDICSGDGSIAAYLSGEFKFAVTGIDLSGVGTSVALKRQAPKTNFCVSLAESPALRSGYFDLIYSFDSFVHIYDKVSLIKECFRLLKSGGKLIFSEWVDNKKVPKKIQNREDLWGPTHLVSKAKYRQLLTSGGFKPVKFSDNSRNFSKTITRWEKANQHYACRLIEKCGPEYFSRAKKRWQLARELSQSKKLSQVIFVCRKPARA